MCFLPVPPSGFLPAGPRDPGLRSGQTRPPLPSASPGLAGAGPAPFPSTTTTGRPGREAARHAKITRQGHQRPSWTRAASSDAPGPFLPSSLPLAPASLSRAL